MNKKLLLFCVPIISVLLVFSVMALDFSVRQNKIISSGGSDYKVNLNVWHDGNFKKGCELPYACYFDWQTQGQGTLNLNSVNYQKTLSLNFREIRSAEHDSMVSILANATGTVWEKGTSPKKVNLLISYVYQPQEIDMYIENYGLLVIPTN